jgi:hypothetical protein
MNPTKADLLEELDDARVYLWTVLDSVDPDKEIYPGWKKREFYAHIGAWEAAVFESFRDHVAQVPLRSSYAYATNDEANAAFVTERQNFSLESVQLEAEINRFAIKALLADIDDFDEVVIFPWGEESVVSWLKGSVQHERDHAEELRHMEKEPRG